MVINDFFDDLERPLFIDSLMNENDSLVSQINYGVKGLCEEDIRCFDVAIVGISDETNAINNEGCKNAVYSIRSRFASLRRTTGPLKIIDLGNVKGRTLDDKYVAIKEVCDFLLENSIIGIILGGGQDFTFPVIQSLGCKKNDIKIAFIDSCIDVDPGSDFTSKNYLEKVLESCDSRLEDWSILGLQKYFSGPGQEDFVENNKGELIRLRDLRGEKIVEAEPFLREANIVSFDVGAVECAYVNTINGLNVNGFTGEEACQLAWYSGMGCDCNFFCFHEFNPEIDNSAKGEVLSAQILWHFVEANSCALRELPLDNISIYKTFVVHLHNFNKDIRFYKNKHNNRWWMELEYEDYKKIVACSETDYKIACSGDVPEKWWRSFKK